MASGTLIDIIGGFLLAFKAVLVEGSEVAILSLATVKQLGKRNVLLGITVGGFGSVVTFLVVRQVFVALTDEVTNLVTGAVILYFSYRFLRGFIKYRFRGKSFRTKMEGWARDVVQKDLEHSKGKLPPQAKFHSHYPTLFRS